MKLIPLFPLQIVVFPTEELNLHIFEPRYRELVNDCENDSDLLFGIPYHREAHELGFGTLVRLEEVAVRYDDGRMDIRTIGVRPFEVKRYRCRYPDRTYPGGYVEETYWEAGGGQSYRSEIRALIKELYQFMDIQKPLPHLEDPFISFQIAHKIGLNKDQEYELLQIVTEEERQLYILHHLERAVPVIKEMETMRKKVQLNGYFKDLRPPAI